MKDCAKFLGEKMKTTDSGAQQWIRTCSPSINMSDALSKHSTVRVGTFFYDGKIECAIRIVHSPVRYGTGDYEDPADIETDLQHDTYYVEYGSTTERGVFNAGSGGYSSLEEAIAAVASAPGIGESVRWEKRLG